MAWKNCNKHHIIRSSMSKNIQKGGLFGKDFVITLQDWFGGLRSWIETGLCAGIVCFR